MSDPYPWKGGRKRETVRERSQIANQAELQPIRGVLHWLCKWSGNDGWHPSCHTVGWLDAASWEEMTTQFSAAEENPRI